MASYKNLINVIDISDLIVLNVSVADIVTWTQVKWILLFITMIWESKETIFLD
jgi:hypothetical protein